MYVPKHLYIYNYRCREQKSKTDDVMDHRVVAYEASQRHGKKIKFTNSFALLTEEPFDALIIKMRDTSELFEGLRQIYF